MDARHLLKLLEEVARLPTAPFHEGAVMSYATDFCEARGIAVRRDRCGNLVLRAGPEDGRTSLALSAHMDHPGFEITDTSSALVKARWMGGIEPEYFPGARVRVFSTPPTTGVCVKTELHEERRRVETMYLDLDEEVREGDLGTWNVLEWDIEGPSVHTRAADDLVGCASVLATLAVLARDGNGLTAWGLLTRAEEVGFLGALGAMTTRVLPPGTPIVSVDCSKELSSARPGRGPVVRVGDENGVFDATLCRYLWEIAEDVHDRYPDFSWQRALMDGGTCEATPYGLFGHPATGVAIPIGNYHNRGEGRTLAAETVHLGDFFGAVTLLVEAARHYPERSETILDAWRDRLVAEARDGVRRLAGDGLAGEG